MASSKAKQAEAALGYKSPPAPMPTDKDYLSCGLTLGNLALHGRTDGGIVKGKIYRLKGRPSGGKTFVARTILAEAAYNPNFKDYLLIYDDVEQGALMDDVFFFGQKAADRIRPPGWYAKTRRPYYSRTVLDFCTRMTRMMKEGRKVIWIEDSLDALEGDLKQTKMGDGKAKQYSQEIRRLVDPIGATGSILILCSQSRMDMDNHGPFKTDDDITAGGRALEHYPSVDIELRKIKSLRKAYKGVKYVTGSIVRARVRKNRISGRDHTFFFPFYPSYGVDDLGSCVNYLSFVKHWKSPKDDDEEPVTADEDAGDEDKEDRIIQTPEFKFIGKKSDLIKKIENEKLQPELRILTGRVWNEIEKAITPERKGRYQ